MSNGSRFPEEELRKAAGATPDSTLSCLLCQAQMQDARVVPGCLHSFCKNCIEKHSGGQSNFPCPHLTCNQMISQPIDSLPANSFFTSIAALDSDNENDKIGLLRGVKTSNSSSLSSLTGGCSSTGSSRMGGMARQTSPTGNLYPPLSQLLPDAPWRPQISEYPINFETPSLNSLALGDNWKQLDMWGGNGNQTKGHPKHQKCGACDENHVVHSHCRDCKEDLCESCVIAHQRVKLTREHAIFHYPDTPNSNRLPATFTTHQAQDSDVIRVYKETVEKARQDNERLCHEAKEGMVECEKALLKISAREREITNTSDLVARNVKQMVEQVIMTIREREAMLLERISRIHNVKFQSLEEQQQKIRTSMLPLQEIVKSLETSNLPDKHAIDFNKKFTLSLARMKLDLGSMEPYEDDSINFTTPDSAVFANISNMGYVSSSGFYKNSKAEGDGLKKGVLGRTCRFIVHINDHLGEPCLSKREQLSVMIQSPDKHKVSMKMGEAMNGQFPVSWRPHVEGDHYIYLQLNSVSLPGSPFMCPVRSGRDYSTIGVPVRVFGREGSGDGEMCRPWGVCCTKEGWIVVADRSNNRIQVFLSNGTFHHKFGVEGKGMGQFNKPASVCCDSRNRLIVSDKDNHRVQIFSLDGSFIMKFGEKGSEAGQFNYPWDVACNSRDHILVSDTRNHRLQLFTSGGEVLAQYGFDGQHWKHFDSPRGVCYSADDQTIVTDFNNHRLLVMRANFENAQYLGRMGTADGEFTRPNGVTVDDEGNIIVADSRNNRIQVFSAQGTFIKKFGSKGTAPGEFETPQGICMTPDGFIVVVDSLHRIQIF